MSKDDVDHEMLKLAAEAWSVAIDKSGITGTSYLDEDAGVRVIYDALVKASNSQYLRGYEDRGWEDR